MIYKLRKKFILISALSVAVVFAVIFGVVYFVNASRLNSTMDRLTDIISSNDGNFPTVNGSDNNIPRPGGFSADFPFTPDTPFSTRFFTVWLDENNIVIQANIEKISSVSETQAKEYAIEVINRSETRGWLSDFRYKICDTDYGHSIVFVNAEVNRSTANGLLYTVLFTMIGSFFIILLLIVLISKRAVKPTAESYEKQKQFVTDANHELKTPLTLILSNVDIVESEVGKNEWLDDIRSEGERMSELIRQLGTLSRMDEDTASLSADTFDLSAAALDVLSEFEGLAALKNKSLFSSVEPSVSYKGDEELIRKLLSILLDNAIKYCDYGGQISITLTERGQHPVITVENTYEAIDTLELDRLFDRFYRSDKSRTYSGSFGIGLSIAQSIVKRHKGEITAYKKDASHIGFRVYLK